MKAALRAILKKTEEGVLMTPFPGDDNFDRYFNYHLSNKPLSMEVSVKPIRAMKTRDQLAYFHAMLNDFLKSTTGGFYDKNKFKREFLSAPIFEDLMLDKDLVDKAYQQLKDHLDYEKFVWMCKQPYIEGNESPFFRSLADFDITEMTLLIQKAIHHFQESYDWNVPDSKALQDFV